MNACFLILFAFFITTRCKSISQNLGSEFEPSDCVWDGKFLFVVDDEGSMASIDANGKLIKKYNFNGEDLEAITIIPKKPLFIYLGVENPPQILEVNKESGKIIKKFILPNNFVKSEDEGLESLTYLENSKHGGIFLCGSQKNSHVYMYILNFDSLRVIPVGSFVAPGNKKDLSAMTIYNDILYFLYDEPQVMYYVKLKDTNLKTFNKGERISLSNIKKTISKHPDQEGLAFNKNNKFIAIDTGDVLKTS